MCMPSYDAGFELEIDDEVAAGILAGAENVEKELTQFSRNQCHLIHHVWMTRREDGTILLRAWGTDAEYRVMRVAVLRPSDRRQVLHRYNREEWIPQAA